MASGCFNVSDMTAGTLKSYRTVSDDDQYDNTGVSSQVVIPTRAINKSSAQVDKTISTKMAHICDCCKKMKYIDDNPEALLKLQDESECLHEAIQIRCPLEKVVKLPGVLHINWSISEYPNALSTNIPRLFEKMSEVILGVEDYKSNILTFWILDVFTEGLRSAQITGMCHRNQRATLLWIAYMYNVIQGTARKISRKEVLLKMNMILLNSEDSDSASDAKSEAVDDGSETTGKKARDVWRVPLPPAVFVEGEMSIHQELNAESGHQVRISQMGTGHFYDGDDVVELDDGDEDPERNLRDTEVILEIVYRIFARLWAFVQIQTSVRLTPIREVIILPYKLEVPKSAPRLDVMSQTKSDKCGRKSTISQKLVEESLVVDKEQTKADQILPLMMAVDMDNFLRELFSIPSQEPSVNEKDRGKSEKKKK